jgi:hypothetical protein
VHGLGERFTSVISGKPEEKRSLGRPIRRWENGIKLDLSDVLVEGDWILLSQGRVWWRDLVNSVMNFRVP